jgi:ATP-binding cassette subfamily B protein
MHQDRYWILPFWKLRVMDPAGRSRAFGLFGLTAVAGAGVFARSLMLTKAGKRIVARMRRQLFASVLAQEVSFFDKINTGDLISRLTADAQMIQAAVTTQAVGTLRGVIMSVGSLTLLFCTSPTLAIVSLCSLPPVFVAARMFGSRLRDQQTKIQAMQADATNIAEEVFQGIKTVRQFTAEQHELERYSTSVQKAHSKAIEAGTAQAAFDGTVHVAANAAILGVLGYGGTMVLSGVMTAGDLAGFLMYSLLMAGNVSSLSTTYAETMKAVAASGRIFSIIDCAPMIPPTFKVEYNAFYFDGYGKEFKTTTRVSKSQTFFPLSVEFRNVHFAYPSRPDARVLEGFSLKINPREVVAIVGSSGSGKSTVASLLTRLYDVDDESNGAVMVGGEDIRTMDPKWLRERIGVVAQEPLLFAESVAENIRYGNQSTTDKQVEEAARIAHVLDFTDKLPDGLDTPVGQRGTQLSGGQKQKVAIARTVLRDPPIVIFDEATSALDASALDAESESHVHEAIDTIMKGRTVISIAHRLSTIKEADRIVVLDNGKVVEDGTFDELVLKEHGAFLDLMGRQITR